MAAPLAARGERDSVREVGPGTVLSGLIKKIDRGAHVVSVEDPQGIAKVEALVAAPSLSEASQ